MKWSRAKMLEHNVKNFIQFFSFIFTYFIKIIISSLQKLSNLLCQFPFWNTTCRPFEIVIEFRYLLANNFTKFVHIVEKYLVLSHISRKHGSLRFRKG